MRNKGFTLIEMLLVVFFISLVTPAVCFIYGSIQKDIAAGTDRQKYYQDISNIKMVIERDFLDKDILVDEVLPGSLKLSTGTKQIEYFFQGNSLFRKEDAGSPQLLAEGFYQVVFEKADAVSKKVNIYFKRNEASKQDVILLDSDYSKWDYQKE